MAPSMVKTSASGRKYTGPGKVLNQRHLLTVQISLSMVGGGSRHRAQGICVSVCTAHNELAEEEFEMEAQDDMEM